MNSIEELLRESEDGRRELRRQDLIVTVTEQIWAALNTSETSKAELARRLDVSKAHITQLLGGQRNMTLATLADIAGALGLTPCIRLAQPSATAPTVSEMISDVVRQVHSNVVLKETANTANPQGRFVVLHSRTVKRFVSTKDSYVAALAAA